MKTKVRDVKLIIVDEISMVSSLNLAYMHPRLEELFGGEDGFGCRNVMFVGDILQLQPVSGNPVFEKNTEKAILNKLGCVTSVNIYVELPSFTTNSPLTNDREVTQSLLKCLTKTWLSH